ncbi:MAG: hypothetical protein AB7V08_02295 [Elusimicrobiales bacterium]
MKRGWKKGIVLVQTLVISIILSMIAVMVMKWVLARYVLAARNSRSSVAAAHSQGYSMDQFSSWNMQNLGTIPSSGFRNLDIGQDTQQRICFCRCPGLAKKVVFFSNQDSDSTSCPSCPGGYDCS